MAALYGDNVFCQANLDVTTGKTKWIDGPCRVHSFYVIPGASNISTPAFLDFYSGDPDAGGVKTLSVPITYSPAHEMQGAISIKIPLNGIRFSDTMWSKISGATAGEPDCTMIIYSGARESLSA